MNYNKIIVLDDDPTGIQSIHDVLVIALPTLENIIEAFLSSNNTFYILTNSRSFSEAYTKEYHENLMDMICEASRITNLSFLIVSRSDSTLRGHYPLETKVIYNQLRLNGIDIDGEIICPYLEGVRKTENDIHYVKSSDGWIKCGDSEFAKDKSFSYESSDLKLYVEEKTKGQYKASQCISISLEDLEDEKIVIDKLNHTEGFNKVIVNAVCMKDLKKFVNAFEKCSKKFIFRCAASLVKELAHITDQPYISKDECVTGGYGGIILVGSHVNKTTSQLEFLKKNQKDIEWLEFNQHKVLTHELHEETMRVAKQLSDLLEDDKIVVVATKRERIDFPSDSREKQLEISNEISNALVGVLQNLFIQPRFLITKGGITSSDALTKGLGVSKEWVLGQIIQNVGVVKCLEGSKFENLPVVIFPGNVGDEKSLYEVIHILR